MTEFAIGIYGDADYRLVKWDGSEQTEIRTWDHRPDFEEQIDALADHHSVGNSPFPTREAMVDAHLLTTEHPAPTRDMTLDDEVLPWGR